MLDLEEGICVRKGGVPKKLPKKGTCWCCDSKTRPRHQKGKKLGPIRCQSSENLDLRSFTLCCDIDPSAMAGRIQVTAYHCTIGSSHDI